MNIGCACGSTRLEVAGPPIIVTECLCDSCRAAAARLAKSAGAKNMLTPYGATSSALYRKDRVRIVSGAENLAEFRLTADAGTRRVVATCCNTPLFMEMKGAHWLDLYLHLWPEAVRPKADVRTMVGDLFDPSVLPPDIPNLKSQSVSFYAKLLWAWIAMGFRNPKIDIEERIDV
ncbi:GFA family protein [Pseudomonas aeruginosa]|nr:hypothetical protein [Pseudomonas aeruginosa]